MPGERDTRVWGRAAEAPLKRPAMFSSAMRLRTPRLRMPSSRPLMRIRTTDRPQNVEAASNLVGGNTGALCDVSKQDCSVLLRVSYGMSPPPGVLGELGASRIDATARLLPREVGVGDRGADGLADVLV